MDEPRDSPKQLSPATSPGLNPVASPGLSPSASPARSRASSRGSHLSLDLSCLPPLTQPAKPTNTLLITNLNNPVIFTQPHITQLRDIINVTAPLASWSPLKSFRRIVCSFETTDAAIAVRAAMDGSAILGDRVRVYFGEHTPLQPVDQHLQAPESKKLFFISPPPSPPHGWEMRNEEPPNQVVVAEDLAHALARLTWEPREGGGASNATGTGTATATATGNGNGSDDVEDGNKELQRSIGRPRSASSVVLFEPEGGDGDAMPAISVDDYTDSGDERSPIEPVAAPAESASQVHTQRPPVELMNHV